MLQYQGPARDGSELKGELFLDRNDKCRKHPKSPMLAFNVGPAWEFYCCRDCEAEPIGGIE